MMHTWIVYRTPSGKTDAVKADHDNSHQAFDLEQEGNVIIAYPCFKSRTEAISYVDQMCEV